MQRLSPLTTRHHGKHTIFVSKDLATCSHVFLRTDSLKKGVQPLYEGPYKVVDRTEKVFRILRPAKEVSVSIDGLKPAYFLKELEDILVEVNVKKCPFNQSKFQTRDRISREKALAGKKPQAVPAAEYVSTPQVQLKISLSLVGEGDICGGCGVLPSRSRGNKPTEPRTKKRRETEETRSEVGRGIAIHSSPSSVLT
ncbi:retrovirus-related Pol polyprotein from transposon 412 [Trichonephila clavata]|uniref:Retrovirus-related Pol polyprotein from transposon 412 n=1 Tax=Trichonephila clavata TaxID=2740835 RepID=A0A8X6LGQ7_TRICU|nr:retrovirus-related Pol polyprotein from transposon 412 [Trichonephila clavata]